MRFLCDTNDGRRVREIYLMRNFTHGNPNAKSLVVVEMRDIIRRNFIMSLRVREKTTSVNHDKP